MAELNNKIIAVSEILFQNDPMRTCCVENECNDEYDSVAAAIVNDVLTGTPVADAVETCLFFDFALPVEAEDLEVIVAEIKAQEIF